MRLLFTLLALQFFLAPALGQKEIALTAAAWDLTGINASFVTHLGVASLHLQGAEATNTGGNIATIKDLVYV